MTTFTHNETARNVARDAGWNLDEYAADLEWSGVNLGPVGQTRDSDPLEESNFQTVVDILAAIDEDGYSVARFGHWACGWVEELTSDAGNTAIQAAIAEIRERLENYPVLDEEDYSRRECERDHPFPGECYSDYCRQDGRCSVSGRFVS